MERCPYCGEWASFEVLDLCLETRELVLDACCEENLTGWIESFRDSERRERAQWMLDQTGLVVKDILVSEDTLHWTLDYGLQLDTVSFDVAKEFILTHHRHCDPPTGWRFGASVFNGHERIGVMTAGNPVSRILATRGYLEITRVCIMDLQPRALVQNACSILYGYGCREAFRRGYKKVVTYTRGQEEGASLRAAGFIPVGISRGGSWNRRGRARGNHRNTGPKVRWERWEGQQLPLQHRLPFASAGSLSIVA